MKLFLQLLDFATLLSTCYKPPARPRRAGK